MTSMGVTTATASVMPAASPAANRDEKLMLTKENELRDRAVLPKKVACPLTAPVDGWASFCLYHSYEVKRMAILGTMPVRTAPSPL